MILYLVQHGKCVSKEEDPGRPLSTAGRDQTRKIAAIAAQAAVPVTAIRHSGKLRAKQTADLFASILGVPDMNTAEGFQPLDDVKDFARKLDAYAGYMLVGHLPFLDRLTSFLLTGNQEAGIVQFRNSGIVCLVREKNVWQVRWVLVPELAGSL